MNDWKCTICGKTFEGDEPPSPCPVCGAGREAFIKTEPPQAEEFQHETADEYLLVGGGVAALEAAKALRQRNTGARITMVCGENVIPYNRPALSDVLAGETELAKMLLQPYDWYARQNIRLECGATVEDIDPAARSALLSDGRRLSYTKLLLATGAAPFCPIQAVPGGPPVFTLRDYTDAQAILAAARGKRVLVVGGGILGIEAALALNGQGCRVTVCELAGRILPLQADAEAGARLARALENQGIALRCGVTVQEASSPVRLTDGTLLEAEVILASIGVRSRLELAQKMGLACQRGVLVDSHMRTSLPGVWAAGDCAQFEGKVAGLYPAAAAMGRVAGANMAGEAAEYRPMPPATALSGEGFSLVSVGCLDAGPEGRALTRAFADGSYRSAVLRQGKVCGVQLWQDVSPAVKAMRAATEGWDEARAAAEFELV